MRFFGSERGSAYVEFAMITPVFLVMVTFLVEICKYYDACVMANHTAFTIGRIAKVHLQRDEKESKTISKSLVVQNVKIKMPGGAESALLKKLVPGIDKSENVVTALLMSTCTFSSFKTGSSFTGIDSKMIKNAVATLLRAGIPEIPRVNQSGIAGFFSGPVNLLVDRLNNKVSELIRWFVNSGPLGDAVDKLAQLVDKRVFRIASMCYNASKIVQKGDVISITPFGKKLTLDYPWHVTSKSYTRKYFFGLKKKQRDGLTQMGTSLSSSLLVSIDYPLGNSWIFPFFLSGSLEKPRAMGRALIFPEPICSKEHLKGTNMTRNDEQFKEKQPKPPQGEGEKREAVDLGKFLSIRKKYAKKFSDISESLIEADLSIKLYDVDDGKDVNTRVAEFKRSYKDLLYLREHQDEVYELMKTPSFNVHKSYEEYMEKITKESFEFEEKIEKLEKDRVLLEKRYHERAAYLLKEKGYKLTQEQEEKAADFMKAQGRWFYREFTERDRVFYNLARDFDNVKFEQRKLRENQKEAQAIFDMDDDPLSQQKKVYEKIGRLNFKYEDRKEEEKRQDIADELSKYELIGDLTKIKYKKTSSPRDYKWDKIIKL